MDVPRDTWVEIPTHDGGTIRFYWNQPVSESVPQVLAVLDKEGTSVVSGEGE